MRVHYGVHFLQIVIKNQNQNLVSLMTMIAVMSIVLLAFSSLAGLVISYEPTENSMLSSFAVFVSFYTIIQILEGTVFIYSPKYTSHTFVSDDDIEAYNYPLIVATLAALLFAFYLVVGAGSFVILLDRIGAPLSWVYKPPHSMLVS